MTDDASRKAILSRRAKFVAAALAGISIAACKDGGPFACLKVPAQRDAETEDAQPQACLAPPPDPVDSGPPPEPDAAVSSGDAAQPQPAVCLTPVRPTDVK